MKSTITLLLMALLTASMIYGQGPDLMAEKSKISSVCDKYSDAWATEDIEKFSALFAHADELVIFDGSSTYIGWDTWKNRLVTSFPAAKDVKVSFRDQKIQINSTGDAAFLTATEDVTYVENGKPFSFKGMRLTWILVKMDGMWVIIHGHWSVPVKD
jgi:uncharacterized protein (TIGR02246 family)